MNSGKTWVSAAEAARLLGVTRATLYAYASRGYVRSQATPGSSRQRSYSREDVERWRQKAEDRRAPDKAAARALHWGLPTLESAITLIDARRLYYRGEDAVLLARTRSVEEVAALIWTGSSGQPLPEASFGGLTFGKPPRRFIARAQSMLATAAGRDAMALDLRPAAVAATGSRILWLLTMAATRSDRVTGSIDSALARAWEVDRRGVDLLRAALILCADHELNVSSFTARCVASAGSHPYAVVIAGLAALEGPRHGGASARVEAMLSSIRRARPLAAAVAERLRRGEPLDGFGHPLYRDGDPRASALLTLLRDRYAQTPEYRYAAEFAKVAAAACGEQPNLDFGLAAMARVLRLPAGSPLVLFGIGRTIGWIGHAIEQYADGQLIRPRARYVGVVPMSRDSSTRRQHEHPSREPASPESRSRDDASRPRDERVRSLRGTLRKRRDPSFSAEPGLAPS